VRRLAAALALALAAGTAGSHEEHGKGQRMREGADERNASATVDAAGNLWAVVKDAGHIAVHRSADAGRTWSAPKRVTSAPEATDSGGDARPKIAAGPGGEVYVTWTRPLGRPYAGEIRFARSVDGGASFGAPMVVHADRQLITHRFDALAVNAKGQVFVAWIDKRDQEAQRGKGPAYRGAAVYWAVSDDRGASFRGDFKLADYSCECCRIALLPRADGGFDALWRHVFEPNLRDHAMAAMLPEGRAGALSRATFDDWRIDVCPHHGPSLTADASGRRHAVWFSGAAKNPGVFYGRLAENRVEGQRRIGGQTAEHADLAAAGNRLAVAWKEFDGARSRLRALRSDDAGASWQERELAVTSGASGQPAVLVRGGQFLVFWNTRNEPLSVTPLP